MKRWTMALCACAVLAILASGCGCKNVDAGHVLVLKKTMFSDKGQLEMRDAGLQWYNSFTWDGDHIYSLRAQAYNMTDPDAVSKKDADKRSKMADADSKKNANERLEMRNAGSRSKKNVDERLEIKGREGRKAWISAYFRYHLDRAMIGQLHLGVGPDYEKIIIYPFVQKVSKNEATTFETFEVYAGDTRRTLQERIIDVLANGEWETITERDPKTGDAMVTYTGKRLPAQLAMHGIIFEDFGIFDVDLEPEYETLVQQKQDAAEKENIAKKVTGQLNQEAEQEKARATGDLNKRVVAAEATKREAVLAAEAEKQKRVLEAEGKKQAMTLEADGVLALGEAEAKRIRLKNEAYASAGGKTYAMVEVAKAWAEGNNREFYMVPPGIDIKLFGGQFADGLKLLFGQDADTSEKPAPATK